MKTNKSKLNRTDGFDVTIWLIMAFVVFAIMYPCLYVVKQSFVGSAAPSISFSLIPGDPSLENYRKVFINQYIGYGFVNTLTRLVLGTPLTLIATILTAYPLARPDLPNRTFWTGFFVFTMFFSGGMIPTYLAMKSFGLLNSPFAVILPGAVNVTNLIIARTYFATSIPWELQEAATIDGCSNTGLFLKIVLPLSMPIVAVIALYYLVGHWNAYFNALIYLSNEKLYPLQLFLRNILLMDQMTEMMEGDSEALQALMRRLQLKESMKYGIVVLSSLPVLVIYPFLQKYFVKGMMIGAIKG